MSDTAAGSHEISDAIAGVVADAIEGTRTEQLNFRIEVYGALKTLAEGLVSRVENLEQRGGGGKLTAEQARGIGIAVHKALQPRLLAIEARLQALEETRNG